MKKMILKGLALGTVVVGISGCTYGNTSTAKCGGGKCGGNMVKKENKECTKCASIVNVKDKCTKCQSHIAKKAASKCAAGKCGSK